MSGFGPRRGQKCRLGVDSAGLNPWVWLKSSWIECAVRRGKVIFGGGSEDGTGSLLQGYRGEGHWFWALALDLLLPEEAFGPCHERAL